MIINLCQPGRFLVSDVNYPLELTEVGENNPRPNVKPNFNAVNQSPNQESAQVLR
jgi:hypothetical protein